MQSQISVLKGDPMTEHRNGYSSEENRVLRYRLDELVSKEQMKDFIREVEETVSKMFPEWAPWSLLLSDPDNREDTFPIMAQVSPSGMMCQPMHLDGVIPFMGGAYGRPWTLLSGVLQCTEGYSTVMGGEMINLFQMVATTKTHKAAYMNNLSKAVSDILMREEGNVLQKMQQFPPFGSPIRKAGNRFSRRRPLSPGSAP